MAREIKEKRWIALWPSNESVELIKSKSADKNDLHLTCYFSPNDKKFAISEPVDECFGIITKIEIWDHANVCVALVDMSKNMSRKYSKHYNSMYGKEDLEHKPHITLGKDFKSEYLGLIGKKIYFNRFGTEI